MKKKIEEQVTTIYIKNYPDISERTYIRSDEIGVYSEFKKIMRITGHSHKRIYQYFARKKVLRINDEGDFVMPIDDVDCYIEYNFKKLQALLNKKRV